MNRVHNFSAGPATLPLSVLEQVQREFLDYQNSGMSLIEMSHRGAEFKAVLAETSANLRSLANIPDNFDILYMAGGASTQFVLAPMNLSTPGGSVGYVNTGAWSKKAIEQAKLQGLNVHICGTSEADNFNSVPTDLDVPGDLSYVHLTSNNTIFGTQYHALPARAGSAPRYVVDMSSDFLSAPIDWSQIGMAYAGAQKNAGPSGVTIVVVDRELYEKHESEKTPHIFRYSTMAKNDSSYNTPPTFQIYVFGLVLKWIQEMGGLDAMLKHNQKKAALIYDAIDSSDGFYIGHAVPAARSLMNLTFNLKDPAGEKDFLSGAEANKLMGLKGHRSVGGFRASTYNAMTMEGCQALADYMRSFAGK